jgi:chorismate-pyruvate lyase
MTNSNWQEAPPTSLPYHYLQWLTQVKRLSHEMGQHSQVQLTVLHMDWQPPQKYEQQALKCAIKTNINRVFVREIILVANKKAFSHGRLCIPEKTWDTIGTDIMALGTNPIGETLLHHDGAVKRSDFAFRECPKTNLTSMPELARDQNYQQTGITSFAPWQRYSIFTLKSGPLLLTETLATALNHWPVNANS